MSRFKKNSVSIQDVIESFHKALYYQDIEKILKLWLNEEHISYINKNGKIFRGIEDIKLAFNVHNDSDVQQITAEKDIASISAPALASSLVNIPQPLYHEILDINIHPLIGGVFVESIEAIKYNQQESSAEYYIYVSYVMMQTHLGWLFLHIHISKADNADISLKYLMHKHKPVLQ